MRTNIPVNGALLCRLMTERGLHAISLSALCGVSAPTIRRAQAGGSLQAEKARQIMATLDRIPPIPELVSLMSPVQTRSA